MNKAITPVVSVILLVMLTIVASVGAYFFITSSVNDLQSSGAIEESPYLDNSRLSLVSITGSQALVRNDGTSPVTEIVVLINGEALNYTLDTPIQPGEIRAINYTIQPAGQDLEIKLIYNKGRTEKETRPASINTETSGFDPTPHIFFDPCGEGNTIVNWDNRLNFFQTDTITCGCNSTLGINYALNTGFENNLDNWTIQLAGQTVEINTTEVHSGEKSLYIKNIAGNPQVQSGAFQNVENAEYFSFWFNGTNASSMSYIYAVFGGGNYAIFYIVLGSNDLKSLCGSRQAGFIHLKCLEGYEENKWNFVEIYPEEDYFNIFGEYPSEKGIGLMVGGAGEAYFDDIVSSKSIQGKYCDTSNTGKANGICYNNECAKSYMGYPDKLMFFINENPVISYDFKNFNSSAFCNLTINSITYSMDIVNGKALKSFQSPLSRGFHESSVECFSDNYFIKQANISSSILVLNKTFANFTKVSEKSYYHAIGEINSSSPGKEIFVISRNEPIFGEDYFVQIFSSDGKFLGFIQNYSDFGAEISIIAEDITGDLKSDILIKSSEKLRMFNDSLDLIWEFSIPNPGYFGGLSIAEINSSSTGKEILMHSYTHLHCISSLGQELWNYSAGSGGMDSSSKINAVIADINSENAGLEILFPSPNSGLYMISDSGILLHNISMPDSPYGINPSVADINSSIQGLEIAYINRTSGQENQSILLLNSTLGVIWEYSFYKGIGGYSSQIYPQSISLGDVTGNGEKEIIALFTNYTEDSESSDYFFNDYIIILNKNGELISEIIINSRWNELGLSLAEVDSENPGLEIITGKAYTFLVLDYLGNELYSDKTGYTPGQIFFVDDIDYDGFIEIINIDNTEIAKIRKGLSSSAGNTWISFNKDYSRTGCQE